MLRQLEARSLGLVGPRALDPGVPGHCCVSIESLVEQEPALEDAQLLGWAQHDGALLAYQRDDERGLYLAVYSYAADNTARVRLLQRVPVLPDMSAARDTNDLRVLVCEAGALLAVCVWDRRDKYCVVTVVPRVGHGEPFQLLQQRWGTTQAPTMQLCASVAAADTFVLDLCVGSCVMALCVRLVAAASGASPLSPWSPLRATRWLRSVARAGVGLEAWPWCPASPVLDAEALVRRVKERFDARATVLDFDVQLGGRSDEMRAVVSAVVRIRRSSGALLTAWAMCNYSNHEPIYALTALREIGGPNTADQSESSSSCRDTRLP